MLKIEGNSFLVIFRKPQKTLQYLMVMQQVLVEYYQAKLEQDKVRLCVGLGFDQILRVGNTEVFGAEVNATCILGENTAKQGETLLTGTF